MGKDVSLPRFKQLEEISTHRIIMKITVKTLGGSVNLEVENGSDYDFALRVFEKTSGKLLDGMDLYVNGNKVVDRTQPVEDGAEIVAIKSKHESAAIKISVKTLGGEVKVECDDESTCDDALRAFEKASGKLLEGMDVYRNGEKLSKTDAVEDGDELVAIKSKHESAAI